MKDEGALNVAMPMVIGLIQKRYKPAYLSNVVLAMEERAAPAAEAAAELAASLTERNEKHNWTLLAERLKKYNEEATAPDPAGGS